MKKPFLWILILAVLALFSTAEREFAMAAETSMPKAGEKAPEFTLPGQNGNRVSLSQFRGKKVILYFYPKDDTPGCTKEACSFRDDLSQYEKLNAVILGVSLDDPKSHQAFMKKYSLNFILLSDTRHEVTQRYGVLGGLGPLKFANRTTFVIDPEGVIRAVFPNVRVDGHSAEILKALETIK